MFHVGASIMIVFVARGRLSFFDRDILSALGTEEEYYFEVFLSW
jgi:hypothetical protein